MKNKKILIDNGHGKETPGKCSPDASLREYQHTRVIARRVVETLRSKGLDAVLLVPEEADIPLSVRASRVNAFCRELGKENVCLVSIHLNAAGCGAWMNARGWEAWTSPGQTGGDILAESLYDAARRFLPSATPIRTDFSDKDSDKESRFYILTKTQCAACLTENLFQDNRLDVEYLKSEEGISAIVALHVSGIENYLKNH